MVRRAGAPPKGLSVIRRGGLVFRISGIPGRAKTVIRLLVEGQYKNDLSYRPRNLGMQLREAIMRKFYRILLRNTPIRTGRLRTSTRFIRNPARVEQGPTPVKGRGYYGRYANRFSRRNAGFYERTMTETARQARRDIVRFRKYRRQIERVEQVTTGRVKLLNVSR